VGCHYIYSLIFYNQFDVLSSHTCLLLSVLVKINYRISHVPDFQFLIESCALLVGTHTVIMLVINACKFLFKLTMKTYY